MRPAHTLMTFAALTLVAGCGGKKTPTETETPSITISVSPASGSVVQGGSIDVTVTVTGSGGFSGAASISLSSPPSGVSGNVGNSQSNGGNTTATLTVAVAAGVAPGAYQLTVRATGSGVAAVTAMFQLTVTAAPAYELSATPAQLMIEQEAQGTSDIGITRTNFTGDVTLAVEGAPAGMSTSFGVNPVGGNAATLTVAPDATVAAGTYTLTIRGTTAGLADRTTTLEVAVTEPAVPDYMLGLTPAALTINQGAAEDSELAITRSNFTGDVTLAAEGVPADVTVSFSDNPAGGASSSVTVTVGPSAPTGTHTITIRGTATGLADRTATLDVTVEDAPAYELTVAPTSLTIAAGASGTVDVSLARTNFAGDVMLALEGAPAGVTSSFSVNPVGGDASVLTLDVGASVAPGGYALTVRGTATGLADMTATVDLEVAPAPAFSFETISPISIQQGSMGTRTVSISRTGGFTGDVTVTVTDLPAGITASVDPVTTAGNSVDVTITVGGAVAVGNHTGTVRGNATGQPEATETLSIAVTTASGVEVSLDFSICEVDQRPVWLAYRDGSGPWTPVSAVGDVYTFNVSSNRAAIAGATLPVGGQTAVLVYYATQAEMAGADLEDLCDRAPTGKTVNATVAGIDVASFEGATLTLGDAVTEASVDGPVTFNGVPDGNLDLVAYKWSFSGSPNRMYLGRDLNPANGSNLGTIDFDGAGAFDPISAVMTLQGGSGIGGAWYTEYATSPSAGVCYYASLDDGVYMPGPLTVRGAPGAQQQAGDFHVVTVTDGFYTVSEMFAALANRAISFGSALPAPTITDITGAALYRRVRAQVTLPADYNANATISLTDDTGDHTIAAVATAAWLDGLAVTIEIPDLSGLAGWDDTWAPTSSSTTTWGFVGYGWTGNDCTEGAREVTAITTGTVG